MKEMTDFLVQCLERAVKMKHKSGGFVGLQKAMYVPCGVWEQENGRITVVGGNYTRIIVWYFPEGLQTEYPDV